MITIIYIKTNLSVVPWFWKRYIPLPKSGHNWQSFPETLIYINMWFIMILFPVWKEDNIFRNTWLDIFEGKTTGRKHYRLYDQRNWRRCWPPFPSYESRAMQELIAHSCLFLYKPLFYFLMCKISVKTKH